MASLSKAVGRKGWRLQFYVDGRKKRSIWLGDLSRKQADSIKTHVEYLIVAQKSGLAIPSQTADWIGKLSSANVRLFGRLQDAGLIQRQKSVQSHQLEAYVESFIDSKRSSRQSTKHKYTQAKKWLVDYFGADKDLSTITVGDAERWRDWLSASVSRRSKERVELSQNTVRRLTGLAKQFFNRAKKDRLITENPFDGLSCQVGANAARQYFVDAAVIDRCIGAAADAEWRAFLALARYGGLRCPSEPMALRWEDISFEARSITIHSPKTGTRVCPLFPELLPYLEDLASLARANARTAADHVFQLRRGSETVWRAGLQRILKRLGIAPWPKLYQNLRASRETELLERYPLKDVCQWIGNSQAIAMRHYAMARDSVFTQAAGLDACHVSPQDPSLELLIGDSTCDSIQVDLRSILCSICSDLARSSEITFSFVAQQILVKNEKTQAIEAIDWVSPMGDAGLEQCVGMLGKMHDGTPVVLRVLLSDLAGQRATSTHVSTPPPGVAGRLRG